VPRPDPLHTAQQVIAASAAARGLDAFARTLPARPCQIDRLRSELTDYTVKLLTPYSTPEPKPVASSKPKTWPRPKQSRMDKSTVTNVLKNRPAVAAAVSELRFLSAPVRAQIIADLLNSLPPTYRTELLNRSYPK
jgi:hypothetical protein